jgi:hypothetical protein
MKGITGWGVLNIKILFTITKAIEEETATD